MAYPVGMLEPPPPPRVMFPPVELMDTPLVIKIPPSLTLSESDHKVIGPALDCRVTFAEVRILLFDFRTIAFPAPVAVILAPAVTSPDALSAVIATGPEALRAAEVVMAPPEEVIDIAPAEEFIAAVLFEIAPEPESVMFPVAEIAPVGATLVPPLIVTTPFDAVSEAEPT